MSSYVVIAIPEAHKNAANRVLNVQFGDSGDNLAQPLGVDGQDPPTYRYGGWPLDAEQANALQTLPDNLPTPEGGWPYNDVTEQQALDAVNALEIFVRTGPTGDELPEAARQAMFAELGVQIIIPPE